MKQTKGGYDNDKFVDIYIYIFIYLYMYINTNRKIEKHVNGQSLILFVCFFRDKTKHPETTA